MKILFLMFLTFSLSFCSVDSKEIANALKYNAYKYNINKKILYTIAKIESNFKINIITFVSEKKWNINGGGIKTKNNKYKNKYLVQIEGNIYSLKKITSYLIQNGYKVDVGLMQINSQNFNLNELNDVFTIDYNIKKAISILEQCKNKFQSIKNTIECYNKGNRIGKKYDYYQKFVNNYIKDFG
ncbi:lytic transglycosylase domain-containing protein [Campylobacter jejuni]|nr:lytic transglycosylase domain-containing protein [Campylobacter jejuni]